MPWFALRKNTTHTTVHNTKQRPVLCGPLPFRLLRLRCVLLRLEQLPAPPHDARILDEGFLTLAVGSEICHEGTQLIYPDRPILAKHGANAGNHTGEAV